MLDIKTTLATHIYEKFKSEMYGIKGNFCNEEILELKINVLLDKYNKQVCKKLNMNIE